MLRSFINNPLRRGIAGALLFACVPDLVGTYFNGISFVLTTKYATGDFILMAVFALIGFGIFHGGVRRAEKKGFYQPDWVDHDARQKNFTSETGKYAWMYDDRIRRFDQH